MRPTKEQIRSIYAGIESRPGLSLDLQGWNSFPPLMSQLINQLRPKIIFDVGVWKGASTVNMATLAGPDALIYAVDIWFGFAGSMLGHAPASQIPPTWDSATHYQQFLFNIKASRLDDRVIPVWNLTQFGALTFREWGVIADLIYVDAHHEEPFVYADLSHYWPLLRSGGVMFGDDIGGSYPGVEAAVARFAKEHGLKHEIHGGHWCIRKL